MGNGSTCIAGKAVIQSLAETFRQLYLAPGEEGERLYRPVVLNGEAVPRKDLSHFHCTDDDSCSFEKTPAGSVRIVTLFDRHDFETFMKIMAFRCRDEEIPSSQGSVILDGVINRSRIEEHEKAFHKKHPDASMLDWAEERSLFLSDKGNYTEALIVLSVGPYSGVAAKDVGYDKKTWLSLSQTIRKVHECTHFICRRLYPERIDPVWDELVADAAGIHAALGHFDRKLALAVLGITNGSYLGGRLGNYVPKVLPELVGRIDAVLHSFENVENVKDVYEYAISLEKMQDELWKS